MPNVKYDEGLQARRRVLGDEYVDRALERAKGNPLTEEQRNFMQDYQRSAQYRSFLRMRKALGSDE